ncbi:hypothetical protein, partial [Gluconobacter sp.]|uniref:hypothetical protein n=1 Tax=Gluconobacter sp. TaxID=1876758 RepID=UPI0039EBE243
HGPKPLSENLKNNLIKGYYRKISTIFFFRACVKGSRIRMRLTFCPDDRQTTAAKLGRCGPD